MCERLLSFQYMCVNDTYGVARVVFSISVNGVVFTIASPW